MPAASLLKQRTANSHQFIWASCLDPQFLVFAMLWEHMGVKLVRGPTLYERTKRNSTSRQSGAQSPSDVAMNVKGPGSHSMQIAYLINQYPQISHTFIRNEIAALEKDGFNVLRLAVRGWDSELQNPEDIQERTKTTYLLEKGWRGAMMALAKSFLNSPFKTSKALRCAIQMSRGGERSLSYHLIYLGEACIVRDNMRQSGVRHVHAHFGTNAAEVAMLVKELGGVSFSFTVHGPEEFDKPLQLKLREKIKSASFVVGISSFGRSQLYRFADKLDWQKIHIVHCGLGDDYLHAPHIAYSNSPRLVCVGRLCEQKGQIILIRACAILKARGLDFEVLLVGDGEMRGEVEQEIVQAKLENEVKITGWRSPEAIREILSDSKGLVLPSFAEGLPVVIMEAMALGRPVISTYVAGIPELVRDEIDGYLVFAGSELHLADAMERLLKLDQDKFREMGASARERVSVRHSADIEAQKLGGLFRTHA